MASRQTSSFAPSRPLAIEEESMTFNRSRRMPRMSSKHNMIIESFTSYGVPLKSGGNSTAVIALQENRKREKRDLNYLNDRFVSYVQRTRLLEGENRKLQLEIEQIREQWASQKSKMQEMYELEMREATRIIDETEKDRVDADLRARRAEEKLSQLKDRCAPSVVGNGSDRQKIDRLQKQISANEADINLFHRRLADLQEEHERFQGQTQTIIADIQQLTREVDHEIVTRIQLESQKEKLEQEIQFLKELHVQKIEQIKQMSLINAPFDPTNRFQRQLSEAVRNVRDEYDQRHYQLRCELDSWYQRKVSQAVQEVHAHRALTAPDNLRSQDEFRQLQVLLSESRQDIAAVRQRNGTIEARIQDLENRMHRERDGQIRATDEHGRQIRELRARLDDLDRDYNELVSTRTSLDSEIIGYQHLLERAEKSQNIRPISTDMQIRSLSRLRNDRSGLELQPRFSQSISNGQAYGNNYPALTAYVPFQSVASTQTEPTIFDQVYGTSRYSATTSFNLPYMPSSDRSSIYHWNGRGVGPHKPKRKTCLGNTSVREERYRKAVTPPSSNYTDAYLSVFSPQPIPTKQTYRMPPSLFTNVAPLPLVSNDSYLSTDHRLKTSETRFNDRNSTLTSNSFDTVLLPRPYLISPHTSNFAPTIATPHQPNVSAQPSSPESQTYDPDHPLPVHDTTSPDKPASGQLQPLSSTHPIAERVDSPYENIEEPGPPPTTTIPTTVTPTVDRSEVPVIQTDEEIRSANVERSSPERLVTDADSKAVPEGSPSDELAVAAAKPLEILENTINKYDTLINEISDILARVSPLTSTVTSMSPKKSAIEQEAPLAVAPVLQQEDLELQEPSATATQHPYVQRPKAKALIRADSYDKIITVITDLDEEMTQSVESTQQSSIGQIKEETEMELVAEENALPSQTDDTQVVTPVPVDEHHRPWMVQAGKVDDGVTHLLKEYAGDMSSNEFIIEETDDTPDEKEPSQYDRTDVTRNGTGTNNDDEDSSCYQSLLEEDHSLLTGDGQLVSGPSTPTTEQNVFRFVSDDQRASPIVVEQMAFAEQEPHLMTVEPPISSSGGAHSQDAAADLWENSLARQLKSVSSVEASPSFLDMVDRRPTEEEPAISAKHTLVTQLASTTNSRDNNAFVGNDPANITLDAGHRERSVEAVREVEGNESDTWEESVHRLDYDITAEEKQNVAATPSITANASDALIDSADARCLSNDVHHGYLDEHVQLAEDSSEMAPDDNKRSLSSALRQTIFTPVVSHIETVPNTVTTVQTMSAINVTRDDHDEMDHRLHETPLATVVEADSTDEFDEDYVKNNKTEEAEDVMDHSQTSKPSTESTAAEEECVFTEDKNVLSAPPVQLSTSERIVVVPAETIISNDDAQVLPHNEETPTVRIDPSVGIDATNTLDTVSIDSLPRKVIMSATETLTDEMRTDTISIEPKDTDMLETSNLPTEPMDTVIKEEIRDETTNGPSLTKQIDESKVAFDDVISFASTTENAGTTDDQNQIASLKDNQPVLSFDKHDIPSTEPEVKAAAVTSENFIDESVAQLASRVADGPTTSKTGSPERAMEMSMNDITTAEIIANRDAPQLLTTEVDDELPSTTSIHNDQNNVLSNLKLDLRALSPTNTEPNSFELIHALRGHSIASPLSRDQPFYPQRKSSSSSTSSPITSSDRYVSYAIHQMNDSSQDRLPVIPIAADMPHYVNRDDRALLEPMLVAHRPGLKEDDLTEFDATDNLTSYSDDILYRRLYRASPNKLHDLDTSSTDDDVDEEFEEHDLSNIHRIDDKATETSSSLSTNEERYHRYDRVMTPSSHASSSPVSRQQLDDIYLIPGYPGLWRTTTDGNSVALPMNYNGDDETKAIVKTKTAGQISDSMRRPLSFQAHRDQAIDLPASDILTSGVPLRPDSLDASTQPSYEVPFDQSESDSYHTCPSSISKQQKQPEVVEINKPLTKTYYSPEESIFLIRERERGVSLPVTMNIHYDDIAFRLSSSTPNDAQLCSSAHANLSLPLPATTDSTAEPSSPVLSSEKSNESKPVSWLDNVNTVTTTTEGADGLLPARVTFQKSAKGPISISECHPQGHHIILDNTSRSKHVDLTNWILCQENPNGEKLVFTFPDNPPLKPNHSLKIFSKAYESERRNDDDLIAASVSTWHAGSHINTTLINPDGKERATLTKKTIPS